jgi:hypothetical protein
MLLLGILIGIAMDRMLFRPPAQPGTSSPPFMGDSAGSRRPGHPLLERLSKTLGLTEQQQAEVGRIFSRHLPRLREARREGGDFQAIRRQMNAELSKVLNKEQLEKFERLRESQREQRRRFRKFRRERDLRRPSDAPSPDAPAVPDKSGTESPAR